MCDMEGEGSCAIWEEHWLKARKPHTCTGCRETIPAGTRYRKTATLHDGLWQNWKHCDRCVRMLAAIKAELEARRVGELFTTETLYMRCGETWRSVFDEDPPAEVAALAFMLPSDARQGASDEA